MEAQLLTTAKLAKRLGVTVVTLNSWVRKGMTPHINLNGHYYYRPEDVEKWLDSRRGIVATPRKKK